MDNRWIPPPGGSTIDAMTASPPAGEPSADRGGLRRSEEWPAPPPAPPPPALPAWPAPPGWDAPPGWNPTPGWGYQAPLPGSGRFRAQRVGELLDAAFSLYRRNVRLIMAITAVVQVPLALFTFLVYELTGVGNATTRLQQLQTNGPLSPRQISDLGSTLVAVVAVSAAILLVQALIIQPIATAAMTRAVGDLYLDKPTSFYAAYRAVASRIRSVVAVALMLFGVGVGLVALTGGLMFAAVAGLGRGGVILWLVLVPGAIFAAIVLYTRWLFAAPAVVLEQLPARAAMQRSWRLVTGSTGRVFGITLLVGIITGILSAIVGGILAALTSVGNESVHLGLQQLAGLVVAVLIQPISYIVVVLLYYDLRIRREAFDIEMLASTL